MNKLNHYVFALSLCLLLVEFNSLNVALSALFSLVFGVLIDYDHALNKKAPWYHKRTWIQEPLGLLFIGVPIALLLGLIDEVFRVLVLAPYASHILLDYLCVFEACPLAPLSDIKKKEGWGIFVPGSLFFKSEDTERWAKRIKEKGIRGISEDYFIVFNFAFLAVVVLLKLGLLSV